MMLVYCPACNLYLFSRKPLSKCPFCNTALQERAIEKEVLAEDPKCPYCGADSVYDIYSEQILHIYPPHKVILIEDAAYYWECKSCGKKESIDEEVCVLTQAKLVDIRWEEFIWEIFQMEVDYRPEYTLLFYDGERLLPLSSGVCSIRISEKIARVHTTTGEIITSPVEGLKNLLVVLDQKTGDIAHQGEAVPSFSWEELLG